MVFICARLGRTEVEFTSVLTCIDEFAKVFVRWRVYEFDPGAILSDIELYSRIHEEDRVRAPEISYEELWTLARSGRGFLTYVFAAVGPNSLPDRWDETIIDSTPILLVCSENGEWTLGVELKDSVEHFRACFGSKIIAETDEYIYW